MPRRAFQYYVFAFAEFVVSNAAAGDPDSASPFLHLLVNREERDPGGVSEIYPELQPVVQFVSFTPRSLRGRSEHLRELGRKGL